MENEDDLFNFDAGTIEEPVVEQDPSFVGDDPEDIQYEEGDFGSHDDEPQEGYLDMLLKAKGIDRKKVQIYDEDNNLTEVDFDELSDQEKFDLLNDAEEPVLPSDDELETLNYLRQNKMSLKDFAEWQKKVGVEEYLAGQTQQTDIDSYSDEEIIAYDFIQRFGEEMTDEEIDAEIDRLKANPEAFQKRVNLLKTAYKNEEIAQAKLYEEEQANKTKADEEAFIAAYNSALQGIDSIQGIDLDNNDKNELFQYVLAKDPNNRTAFSKAMDDPESVLKMAWFMLHGEEAMKNVVDYFKSEITKREKGNQQPRVVNKQTRRGPKDAFQF